MGCLPRIPILLVLPLALLAGLATAQVNPIPALTVAPESIAVESGGSETLTATVSNNGPRPAPTQLTFTSVPPGWTITFVDPAQQNGFSTPAGGTVRVELRAAPTVEQPQPSDGTVRFTATMTNDLGQGVAPATDDVEFDYVPPPPIIAPVPPDRTAAIVATLVGIVLGVAVLGAAVYLYLSSRVDIRFENTNRPVTLGSSETYVARVTNTALGPRNMQLRLAPLPDGWFAAFAFPTILTQPKETVEVPLSVRAPSVAAPNSTVRIQATARPGHGLAWLRKAQFDAVVVDPESRLRAPSMPGGDKPLPPKAHSPKLYARPAGLVHPISDLEGISPDQVDTLARLGLTRVDQLLPLEANKLSHAAQIPVTFLQEWQSVANLLRILGVGPHLAALLVQTGIRNVEQLAEETPDSLVRRVSEYVSTTEHNRSKVRPYLNDAPDWIEAARAIRRGSSPRTDGKTAGTGGSSRPGKTLPSSVSHP